MLKSLASQICEADKKYTTHLDTAAKRDRIVLAEEDIGELWSVLFQDFYQEFDSHTALVLDGLNETIPEDLDTFVDVLTDSIGVQSSSHQDNLHILLLTDTSSNDKWKKAFGESVPVITLSATANQADLRLSVQKKLDEGWTHTTVSKALRDEVENSLLARCQGNFLWLSLVLDSVLSKQREDGVRALMSDLPSDVRGAVTLILDRLNQRLDFYERQDLCDVVAWVACSPVAPSIADLDALLAMRKSGSSRVINLERLICEDWAALFVISRTADLYETRQMQQRLEGDAPSTLDTKVVSSDTGDTDVGDASGAPSRGGTTGQTKDPQRNSQLRLSNTRVRLAGDIAEHFKDCAEDTAIHPKMPELSMLRMRVRVLCWSLEIMCTDPKIQPALFRIAHPNCALWLPPHLCDIDVSKVSHTERQRVVWYLVRILRDRKVIQRWLTVEKVRRCITYDLLHSPDVQRQLLLWFQTPSALSYLSRADQDWIHEAIRNPTQHLFREIALCNAYRWLLLEGLESALFFRELTFNFEFLNTYLEKTNPSVQIQKSDSSCDGVHISTTQAQEASDLSTDANETFAENSDRSSFSARDYSLETSSAGCILEVARWAALEESRLWNSQVARALAAAGHFKEALEYHKRAHELDPYDARVANLLGGCHWALANLEDDLTESMALRRSGLSFLEKARDLFSNQSASELLSDREKSDARGRYYDCLCNLAPQYRSLKMEQEELAVYEELLGVWEEPNEEFLTFLVNYGISFHLDDLEDKERYHRFAEILERAIQHPKIDQVPFSEFYSQRLRRGENILAFAHKSNRLELAVRFWENGKRLIDQRGQPGERAALRWHYATLLLRLAPDKSSQALEMLNEIGRDPEVATLADELHLLKAMAESELARHYLDRALSAVEQDRWSEAGHHAHQLTLLSQESADEANEPLLFLAVWNRLNGRLQRAKRWVRPHVQEALDMLFDDDEENDEWAWWSLGFAVTVVGDEQRAKAVHGILGSLAVYGNVMELVEFSQSDDEQYQDAGSATEHPDNPEWPMLESEGAAGSINDTGHRASAALTFTADVDSIKETSTRKEDTSETMGSGLETHNDDSTANENSWYSCDGPCFQQILWSKTVYRCNYCVVDLCESCHDLVKAGKSTGFAVCSMTHEFFEFPPIEQYPPKKMKVGSDLVFIKDWLSELAEDWDIKMRMDQD